MANQNQELKVSAKDTHTILSHMWHQELRDNPYLWAMYAFPWGKKPIEQLSGPYEWQKDEMLKMAAHIKENKKLIKKGLKPTVYYSAIASGNGIGKSAFVGMITNWMITCVAGSSTIVSANTMDQLQNFTFGEISKWHAMSLASHCFDKLSLKLTPAPWFAKELQRAQGTKIDATKHYVLGKLWDEDNPDAFAGEHSTYGMMVVFDEASGIPEPIWETAKRFFTEATAYRFMFALSNPRRNTGPFYDCFHSKRELWNRRQIDSRSVDSPFNDPAVHDRTILENGEDSDAARVTVRGEFPKHGDSQFISRDIVDAATTRELERYDDFAALCMGVDVARFGDDLTVISFRRGRDARSIPSVVLKGLDNMKVVQKVTELIEKYSPDAVFIDGGAGAGVIDRLKELGHKVFEVLFGSASSDPAYSDHRTEMWAKMRDWLKGAMISPTDKDLHEDLCAPEYEFIGREDKTKLESKEKMKKRKQHSPDRADALALTFHAKVSRMDVATSRNGPTKKPKKAKGLDYKIFG